MFYRVPLYLFLLALLSMRVHAATENNNDLMAIRSEWWPERVSLKDPMVGPLNGQMIRAGREGFLVRFENDYVLIDFGRYGLLNVPVTKTDFAGRFDEAKTERKWDDVGLWTAQFQTKIRRPTMEGFSRVPLEQFQPADYVVLVYINPQSTAGQEFLASVRALDDEQSFISDEFAWVLIPTEIPPQDYLLELLAYEYPQYTLMPPYAGIYRNILQHDAAENAIVVIDKNGRIIVSANSLTADTDLNSLYDRVKRRIADDKAMRLTTTDAE